MSVLDRIPLVPLAIFTILLALLPFKPQPHLYEKLSMLVNGTLSGPMDSFDLLWHSWLIVILALKLIRINTTRA